MKNVSTSLLAATAFAFATPALADEVWTAKGEEFFYETDLDNGVAVISHENGKMFIQGLAGEYEGRTEYDGFFIQERDTNQCDIGIENPQTGAVSYSWGRVHMVFIDPDFPSRWVAFGAECLDRELADPIFAEPVVGE